jgi:asparagine synthase (glutamine-hydrolysing)
LSEGEGPPVKTFSIGYEGEYKTYKNELHHARLVAARVGADHHERLMTLDEFSESAANDGAASG